MITNQGAPIQGNKAKIQAFVSKNITIHPPEKRSAAISILKHTLLFLIVLGHLADHYSKTAWLAVQGK
jgi:hypothetical protein